MWRIVGLLSVLVVAALGAVAQEKPAPPPVEKQLELAIKAGDVAAVTQLIRNKGLVEQFYVGGVRPLHLAAIHNQPKVTEVLLAAGANRRQKNQQLRTPLDVALANKHFAVAQAIYDGVNEAEKIEVLEKILDRLVRYDMVPQYEEFLKMYPEGQAVGIVELDHLFLAASSGCFNMLTHFVNQGRSYSEVDPESGWTVLHFLAGGGHAELIEQLRDQIPDMNAVDALGRTPLCVATIANKTGVVPVLLKMGADPNTADMNGQTALHHAAWWGDQGMTKALLAAGADAKLADASGDTPADVAMDMEWGAIAAILPAPSRLASNRDGDFGPILAECRRAIRGNQIGELKRRLGSSSLKLNATDGRGFALLHYAALQDSLEMTQALIDAGADVNVQDATSAWTPLMIAVGGDQLNLTKTLLMNAANVNIQDVRGITAMHLASMNGNEEMLAALRLARPDESLSTREGILAGDVFGYRDQHIREQQEEDDI